MDAAKTKFRGKQKIELDICISHEKLQGMRVCCCQTKLIISFRYELLSYDVGPKMDLRVNRIENVIHSIRMRI